MTPENLVDISGQYTNLSKQMKTNTTFRNAFVNTTKMDNVSKMLGKSKKICYRPEGTHYYDQRSNLTNLVHKTVDSTQDYKNIKPSWW